jgi:D-beta-D-heptose 7-phosphate kinase/D-beta-D-heptose 1-phosphate adenosyltransferase
MDSQPQEQLKNSLRVLVIGDSCEDLYHYGSCERLSPEAPVPILKLKKTESKPGMCLNVAKNLEGLGLNVDVITQKQQIKKHRYVEEKRLVHLLRMDEELNQIDEIDIEEIKSFLNKNIYDAIVISDYNKGFLSYSSCVSLIEVIDNKIPVFVDSKKQDLSCYSNCIIKINKQEKENVKSLPNHYELIVTLGENGAIWKNNHYPTNKSKLYDVCGAGDTFLAGLVFKYLESNDLDQAIYFANKCASISVTHFGNFILSKSDVT